MSVPALELHQPTGWTDRLAFDIALTMEGSGFDVQEVLTTHDILPEDLAVFSQDPVFARKVEAFRGEIRDKGVTFKLKARAQAEELLATSWAMIHDNTVSSAVRADLLKATIKWAGLEPKGDVPEGPMGEGVKIVINMGVGPVPVAGDGARQVVDAVVDTPMVSIG